MRIMLIFGMLLTFILGGRVAQAGTIADVQAQIDSEYAAGNMSNQTYQDVSLALKDVKLEGTVHDTEAFKLIVAVYAGNKIQADAADRILAVADGL